MADTKPTHRYVGTYAKEIAGHFRAPGDFFTLSKEQLEDPHVQDLANNSDELLDLKGGDKSDA